MAYYDLEATGSSIQSNRMGEWVNDDVVSTLYNAIQGVETGGLQGDDRYIRTKMEGSGSSAYGPLQMTAGEGSMMQNIYNDAELAERLGITDEEMNYIGRYINQGEKFLESVSDESKSQYGYGGIGELSSPENQQLYDSVGKKFINYQWHNQAQGNPTEFIKKWHMGTGPQAEADWGEYMKTETGQNYLSKFLGALGF